MSQWKMDPARVTTVLTNTGETAQGLQDVITEEGAMGIFAPLEWGGVVTQDVPIALHAVLEEQQTQNLQGIANRIRASQEGIWNAANALNDGNIEMAETFHSEMTNAAETGDFSFFEEHGVQS